MTKKSISLILAMGMLDLVLFVSGPPTASATDGFHYQGKCVWCVDTEGYRFGCCLVPCTGSKCDCNRNAEC
jgi:hypothetical protein